jgi:hypothetical protein
MPGNNREETGRTAGGTAEATETLLLRAVAAVRLFGFP